ncbi:hypothetical protein ASPBRDRAFT_597458 [Aspergillus brasiliensis CBS 101740]|uniref:Uncharacterized protein n=1 Tax=Aspergillus brasiliensis (strain CBS 101740 / IMI 381727 / IBT 21946) TaxID=767769 RepID=A0A1L9UGX2_ASPBC|nr:hypothetical protein ASPBRDRAFT_597458 [Aspergillus brasiliensis CBS 101740]
MMIRGQCNWASSAGSSSFLARLSAAATKFSPSFFACWNWFTLLLVGNLDRELRFRQPQLLSVRIIPQSPNRVNQCPVVISIIKVYSIHSILCLQAAWGAPLMGGDGYVDLPLKRVCQQQ